MPLERILIIIGLIAVIALFGFQLWSVLRTGHVRWRVQKVRRANRPVAFWLEVAACVGGVLGFAACSALHMARGGPPGRPWGGPGGSPYGPRHDDDRVHPLAPPPLPLCGHGRSRLIVARAAGFFPRRSPDSSRGRFRQPIVFPGRA